MSARIVRFALAATVAAGGIASASEPTLPPLPNPTVVDLPPGSDLPHLAQPEMYQPLGYVEGHEHDPHSSHGHGPHKSSERGYCVPGVYKTEISNFRGDGFAARKRPYTPDLYTMERSGNPHEISHLAEPSYDEHYTGYYVGGGVSLFNKAPGFHHRAKEGTWGWDYEHVGLKRRVNLLFSRGALYQDGDGQYESDPPFEIPNIFAIRYGERFHRLIGHGAE